MIAWRRVLLLERCLVLLVDDDESETCERQEDGGACAEDNVVRFAGELLLPYLYALGIAILEWYMPKREPNTFCRRRVICTVSAISGSR